MHTTMPSPVGSLLNVTATRMKRLVSYDEHIAGNRAILNITDTRSTAARQRLIELLNEHSRLAYQFCVLSDAPWQILWSSDRQSYLPFFERAFTLVALSDPVGLEKDRKCLLEQFFTMACNRGKHAVIVLATDSIRRAALDLGFAGLWVGTEPLFDLSQYSLTGKKGRKLRQEANRMRSLGGSTREIFPLKNEADRQSLEEVARQWKAHLSWRYNTSFLGAKPMENACLRRYFTVETPGDVPGQPICQSFLVCSPVSRRAVIWT